MKEYRAKEDLYIGMTKARNKGDMVTKEDADRYGWEDKIEEVGGDKKSRTPKSPTGTTGSTGATGPTGTTGSTGATGTY